MFSSGALVSSKSGVRPISSANQRAWSMPVDVSGKSACPWKRFSRLPSDSPWRSDVKSFFRPATSYTAVTPRTITNPYANSASAIIDADRAYKTGEVVDGGAGGGGSAPTNPCGG